MITKKEFSMLIKYRNITPILVKKVHPDKIVRGSLEEIIIMSGKLEIKKKEFIING